MLVLMSTVEEIKTKNNVLKQFIIKQIKENYLYIKLYRKLADLNESYFENISGKG